MADVQKTRAQVLALFADNVTGQISAQDLRDWVVTMMETEFAYAGDFWKQPGTRETTTDATCRGWKDYSQVMNSACSFMNVLALDSDGGWVRADVADSTLNGITGLAVDSYASNASDAVVLRRGMVYYSLWSAMLSNYIGRPIYLDSGVPGSMSIGITTNSQYIVGWVEASDDAGTASGKWRFDPQWSIKGN